MSRNARILIPALAVLVTAAAVRPTLRSFARANPDADDAASAARLLSSVRGIGEPVCQLVVQAIRNQQFGRSPAVLALQGDEVPRDPTALWALSQMRTPGAVQALSAGLRDADPCVRAVAARMLAKTRFAASYDALLAGLGDQDSLVRAGAARALGRQHDRRAPERLLAALHDPAATVRASAAFALGDFGRRRFGCFDCSFDFNFDMNFDFGPMNVSVVVPPMAPMPPMPAMAPSMGVGVGVGAASASASARIAEVQARLEATQARAAEAADRAREAADRARDVLDRERPDVLVCDIAMPGESGYEFLLEVRARDSDRSAIPAIALTAYARDEDRERAMKTGFQLYLAKPVERDFRLTLA